MRQAERQANRRATDGGSLDLFKPTVRCLAVIMCVALCVMVSIGEDKDLMW